VSDRDGTTMGVDEYFQSDASDAGRSDEQPGDDSIDQLSYGRSAQNADRAKAEQDLAPIPGGGPLLEESNTAKIFKSIDRDVKGQERLAKNREEQRKHWTYVLGGCQFSTLDKSEDQSIYRQQFPPGIEDVPQPIPNKVQDLANSIVSQVLVDPFVPNPKPDGANSDRNRGAADLTKKFLRSDGAPTGTNDQGLFNELLNGVMTDKSSFAWVWIDPMGGGWRPKQYKAHPRATDPRNPLVAPKLGPDGQPILGNDGQPIMERTTDPILRYVAEATSSPDAVEDPSNPDALPRLVFTNNPADAARQWMPKHKRRVLGTPHVRTHPRTATVLDARAITLLLWETLGEAKDRFPILKSLGAQELKQLCNWKPRRWEALVPEALRQKGGSIEMSPDGTVDNETLFFWYHRFCRITDDYPDGAEIAVTGGGSGDGGKNDGFLLRRDTLREDVELEDGTVVPVLMDPPISQFKGANDTKGGDPFGVAVVSLFGGANETLAHLYMSILDTIDKGLHRNLFIPATSPVTKQDLQRRDGTPIEILVAEDKPIYEETPELPAFTPDVLDRVERGINASAGVNETANALDSTYARSGVAKDISIRQAKVRLAQIWQNAAVGVVQYWQVKKQLAQARLTVPQEVMLAGIESAYKQRWFVGGDLIGVREVAIASGSGTMMAPMEKLNLIGGMQTGSWLDPAAAGELARSTMSDDLGLPPDPHEEHIDRCIGEWIEGPPSGWEQQYAQNQQLTQQYQTAIQQRVAVLTSQGLDPATAQQTAQQQIPQPQIAPLSTCFEPRPNDEERGVAAVRVRKLSKLMATPDYSKHSPAWRSDVDNAYALAFYASGGQTVRQQAAATAAQQQQAQAPGAAGQTTPADANAKAEQQNAAAVMQSQNADANRAHAANEAERDRAHASSENAKDRNGELAAKVFNSVLAHRSKLASAQPLPQIA
jgi:hypothetical protein